MFTLNLIIIVIFLFFFGWQIRLIFRNSIYFIFIYYSLFLFFRTSSKFYNIRIALFTLFKFIIIVVHSFSQWFRVWWFLIQFLRYILKIILIFVQLNFYFIIFFLQFRYSFLVFVRSSAYSPIVFFFFWSLIYKFFIEFLMSFCNPVKSSFWLLFLGFWIVFWLLTF